jgi:NAD(P)-dependent dehydrogenase (short-subunit alcohol dehydrogenase family)
LTERLLPYMNDGGHIVNMSSGSASLTQFVGAYVPSYKISKVAVNMYTRTLAARLADRKITLSSFNPGWVRTDMGGPGATRDPSQPARELYELATSDVETGYFWYRCRKMPW